MRALGRVSLVVALLAATAARGETPARPGAARAAAARRAAGAALLALGAVMRPISIAWYLSVDERGCGASCASVDQRRGELADRAFAGWQVANHLVAITGGTLLVHGRGDRSEDGPTHPAARGLRIFGGVLVAAAAVLLPLGVLVLDNDLGGRLNQRDALDAGVGVLSVGGGFLAGGIAMVAAGAYYDPAPSALQLGANPILRAGADGRTAWLGAVATLSGRF